MIYMDNIATTKPDDRVVDTMIKFLKDDYGNPSAHFYPLGRQAFEAVLKAREQVASLINAESDEIIFTSCGTESNNLAIKGLVDNLIKNNKTHIILSEIEHYSVQNCVLKLLNHGFTFTKLKVDNNGFINIDELRKNMNDKTGLVTLMHANPEIGTIQETQEIGEICREKNIFFHVDAVASCGHASIDVKKFNCDLLSIAAQNFYGPKGAAALYIRNGVSLNPLFDGGFQEKGLRSGSENVPAIVGMGVAAAIAKEEMANYTKRMVLLRDRLIKGIENEIKYLHFTGDLKRRLPGHVSFWIEYIEGESILLWLALKDVCAASGSACSSNIMGEDERDLKASHVLSAIGVPSDICAGSITFSLSKYNTEEEVDYILKIFPELVEKLLEMSPFYEKKGGKN
jgi:cysteine desulfurase